MGSSLGITRNPLSPGRIDSKALSDFCGRNSFNVSG
jgi:hypothetical protein